MTKCSEIQLNYITKSKFFGLNTLFFFMKQLIKPKTIYLKASKTVQNYRANSFSFSFKFYG